MILEMDFGNSRIKWRLREGQNVIVRNAVAREKGLAEIKSAIQNYIEKIEAVWVASVLDENAKAWINFWVRKNIGLTPVYAASGLEVAGVINGYDDPARLGVDRWLAMIAAFNVCHTACIVISAGTALTVDLVDQDGRHLGGYIVPGWKTSVLALNHNTQLINLMELKASKLEPGTYTQSAVVHGLGACYVGLIQNAITQLAAQTGANDHAILATGGEASRLLEFFPDIQLHEELILDGLAYCLV
jgi:type III pantothenate kinase